ncbi:polysaccharide pyruvyl transferase CsaB [Cohnella sp. CFH 77786]|uniref:polysaccharide pyruvyl transferase family protein n=1 Tax=Cohnella sp. CFH 77786 TaxID=2662265 RepID=UPI001C60B347|nr:polysaccharide pyruvyl transferase family protein [Cohnella sp. CFH 77786]MBW5445901.1 polysaccharide pyruvyl transferase CsaB [Cohnella sp. CFH 77786]
MRLVLSGYYGFKNSGDEAVLKSILTALEHAGKERGVRVEPVVLSGDPDWTSRQYGVEAVPRLKLGAVRAALRSSDGLISGGGSLLQDATGLGSIPYYLGIMEMARWCGKPTFVYAQGIGPVNRSIFRWPIARAFRKAAYVSVRDEESAALLRQFGVPGERVEVVPDPVMGLPMPGEAVGGSVAGGAASATASGSGVSRGEGVAELAGVSDQGGAGADCARTGVLSESAGRSGGEGEAPLAGTREREDADGPALVGVSVRFWRGDRADLDRAAAALEALAGRRSVRLRFLPFHHGLDEDASRYVMERLASARVACELAPAHDEPQAMLGEVGRCRLLFGMRLHSLIYAANREVPLLGLSYDPKIDQFLARIGQKAIGSTEALDPAIFADRAARLLDDPDAWRISAGGSIDRLKKEAIRPAQQILDYKRI